MADRSPDWYRQAVRDLDQARDSQAAGRHEWACFAAHQAAEKAVKSLHLHNGQEAGGQLVARLVAELPAAAAVPADLAERGRVLDNYYVPPGTPTGTPRERRSSTTDPCRARRRCAMPTRPLRSSVLRWPDAATVGAAAHTWAREQADAQPTVQRIGYFGSYARGDWGVGSDLDLVVILDATDEPFEHRASSFETTHLPVPADVAVYAACEWETLRYRPGFGRTVPDEVGWLFKRE